MTIDWSKAPVGTTGAMVAEFNGSTVRRGDVEWIPSSSTQKDCYSVGRGSWVYHEAPPKWNGEGLPPVGTVCEIRHEKFGWTRCEIVAHKHMSCGGKSHAIAWIDGDHVDQSQGTRFRPIRTAEQIAEDERLAGIAEIQRVVEAGFASGSSSSSSLWDAGYRKQVAP